MNFYNRKEELFKLAELSRLSKEYAHLTIITGRRRIGKTELIGHFLKEAPISSCYLFVARKKAAVLLEDFRESVASLEPLAASVVFTDFEHFFRFLFEVLKKKPAIIVFDEFQNFDHVDSSVFSILQKYWDENHKWIKGQIICIGSIFTLMKKIFEGEKEPLFSRATSQLLVRPFSINVLAEIIKDSDVTSLEETILSHFTMFGGVPKYYHLLERHGLTSASEERILEGLIFNEDAPLLNEGRNILIEEFGKDHLLFFTLLQVIAGGESQISHIASKAGVEMTSISRYLDDLVNYYQIVERRQPVTSKEKKTGRYFVKDQFLRFWFRYVFRNQSQIEIGNFDNILRLVGGDIRNLKGYAFEEMAREMLIDLNKKGETPFIFLDIGGYWNRRGDVEIDVVATNEKSREILFAECKLDESRIDAAFVGQLKSKAETVEWKRNSRKEHYAVITLKKLAPSTLGDVKALGVHPFSLEEYLSRL